MYEPKVAWSTLAYDVTYINSTTFTVRVSPLNINEPGAKTAECQVGYYFIDFIGNKYDIVGINVDGEAGKIQIVDSLGYGIGPQGNQIGFVYESVGDGGAPYVSPIIYSRLDKSAFNNSRARELDVIWKNRGIRVGQENITDIILGSGLYLEENQQEGWNGGKSATLSLGTWAEKFGWDEANQAVTLSADLKVTGNIFATEDVISYFISAIEPEMFSNLTAVLPMYKPSPSSLALKYSTQFELDVEGNLTIKDSVLVPATHSHEIADVTGLQTALDSKISSSLIGASNGVAQLDSYGIILSSQLPSFVDDVLEYANFAALPETGETAKIYVTTGDNLTYRWSGTQYIEISKSLALGITSSTAFRGDWGKMAYDKVNETWVGKFTWANNRVELNSDLFVSGNILASQDVISYFVSAIEPDLFSNLSVQYPLQKPSISSIELLYDDTQFELDVDHKLHIKAGILSWSGSITHNEISDWASATASFVTGTPWRTEGYWKETNHPTTISGYGITDSLVYTNDSRLTDARPASDVYAWAKQATKPAYDFSELNSKPTSLAGYGISDTWLSKFSYQNSRIEISCDLYVTGSIMATQDVISYFVSEIAPEIFTNLTVAYPLNKPTANSISFLFDSNQFELDGSHQLHIKAGVISGTGSITHDDITDWASATSSFITGTPWRSEGYWKADNHPTTVADYGLPAYPTSLPASDVYAWAKASTKPPYDWSEIASRPTNLSQFTNDLSFAIHRAEGANYIDYAWGMLDQYQGGWRGSGDLKVKYSAQADNALLLQNYDVDKMMWFQSMRDFSYGTLIETDIPYNVTSGDIWFLEIKGNPYTSNASFDIKVHAYIYYDTLIYVGGLSNGSALSDLVAICHNNHLCFWFSTQSYFQGFEIFCAAANAQGKYANRVISVTDVDKPTTYKEVNLWAAMTQSLTTANYTSYTVGKDGTGASGTWNITAQNAHTVDGYHANELICKGASGHYEPATWIKLGITGLYSSTNGAYLYPNDGTYGSWKIQGTKGGWSGIEFDSGNVLMMNAAESGFYNVNYGWQIHWSAGSLYCNKGASGGGTQATVLDTSNYGSLISALSQTITATDFILGSSDKDRKSNIKPLMDTEGNIARPMVDYYSFNLDSKDRKRYGALYQDVQPLYPELAGEVDGKKGLAYIDLLIWETAYNKNRVDLLEKEVSRLKGRVAYLEGRAI